MSKKAVSPLDLGLEIDAPAPSLRTLFAASTSKETEMQRAIMIELDRLADNPYQPRLEMDEQALEELAKVVRLQGFQGVLVARPDSGRKGFYQLTAGHRRREAARRAGLRVLPVAVQDLTDEEMIVRAITENIQREDLSPLEEGKIYLLMSGEMGYTYEQIAREVGKSIGYVRNRLRVASAPEDVQALVQAKPDTLRAVVYLTKVADAVSRAEIIEQIARGALATDDIPGYIDAIGTLPTSPTIANAAPAEFTLERSEGLMPAIIPEQVEASDATTDTADVVDIGTQSSEALIASDSRPSGPSAQSATPNKVASERTLIRVRRSKLTSVLRTLLSYQSLLTSGPALSEEEITSLGRIGALADKLAAEGHTIGIP